MSRIATLTAVVALVVAPAALAGPADYGTPDQHTAARAALTQVYAQQDLRSPDARDVVTAPMAHVDLRSPDAVNGFVSPTETAKPAATSDGNLPWWAFLAMITAAFCACGLLTVMLRRHLDVGRPASV
jgi:hypothetical protein